MTDYATGMLGAAAHMWEITPNDSVAQDPMPKAIRCDAAGTLVMRTRDSDTDVTMNVLQGETIFALVKFVKTGTTVTVHGIA